MWSDLRLCICSKKVRRTAMRGHIGRRPSGADVAGVLTRSPQFAPETLCQKVHEGTGLRRHVATVRVHRLDGRIRGPIGRKYGYQSSSTDVVVDDEVRLQQDAAAIERQRSERIAIVRLHPA